MLKKLQIAGIVVGTILAYALTAKILDKLQTNEKEY